MILDLRDKRQRNDDVIASIIPDLLTMCGKN